MLVKVRRRGVEVGVVADKSLESVTVVREAIAEVLWIILLADAGLEL